MTQVPFQYGAASAQLDEILDRISDAFVAFDREWRYRYVNRAAEDYIGVPRQALLGRVVWDVFPQGEISSVAHEYLRAAAGTEPVEVEMLSPVKKRWVAHRIYPSAAGVTVYFRDVTERRQAADALRDSEEQYRSLFDHSLDGVLLTMPSGEILAANPTMCRMLHRTEEEICRLGRSGVVDPDDSRPQRIIEERRRTGSARGEINLLRADGIKVPVEMSSTIFTDRSGRVLTSMSVHDLTARKRAELAMSLIAEAGAELARSLERDDILRRLTSLVVPRFADLCIVDVLDGPQLRRAAVRHRDADWGGALAEHSGPSQVIRSEAPELVAAVADDGGGLELAGVRSVLRVPMLVAGTPTGVLSLLILDGSRRFVADDVRTAQAIADRLALALENARLYEVAVNAKRVRDDVMAMVTHDLRTPLNAIGLTAMALEAQGGNPLASKIQHAVARAGRLIDDLMAVAVIESGTLLLDRRLEPVDSIVAEVADICRPLAEVRAITLRVVVENEGLMAWVDRHRVVQAVSNVVSNAVKFSPDGEQVELVVSRTRADLEIAVHDRGPGIPPDEVPRLFDRFWRGNQVRRGAGAGLGLAISKGCIDAHGGRIDVASRPGRGSTFTLSIPLRSPGLVAAPVPPLGPASRPPV